MVSSFEEFRKLFDKDDVTEGQLQAFMETNTETIPTPGLLGHDLQWNSVISQFAISSANVADYAYITKNTANWKFVFVELERPQKRLLVDKPHVDFADETGKAVAQIEGWKSYVENNKQKVVDNLRILMQPHEFWDNPIQFEYVLIIGRNPKGMFPTSEHAGRIKRLAQESSIHLLTYDSILRMNTRQGVGSKKNVLKHSGNTYAFKTADADTSIFAHYDYGQVGIDDVQIAWFNARGYDMDSWRKGERLVINHKMPDRRMDEVIDGMFAI